MKKIDPRLSMIWKAVLAVIFIFSIPKPTLSQDFITEWTFTEDTAVIRFNAQTTGDVNYFWITRPSNLSGNGTFIQINAGAVVIDNFTFMEGDTLTLIMAPDHLSRFYSGPSIYPEKLIDVRQWGAVKWTSMERAFYYQDLNISASDKPNLSNVTSMQEMFFGTQLFNSDIGSWDVSNVKNMRQMFSNTAAFNSDISMWDVSNVTDMSEMFLGSIFNQDIGIWNVSKVTNMTAMLGVNDFFNQDLSNWDVSNVVLMDGLLVLTASFNQDLSMWNFNPEVSMQSMFSGSHLDCENYSKIISAWRNNSDLTNKTIGVDGLKYGSNIEEERQYLIEERGWTFVGDELNEEECDNIINSQDFITKWTFTEDATMIRFNALSTGEVNYSWTTRPSNLSGEGSFSRIEPGLVTIEIDIEEGDTLVLKMKHENLRRFYSAITYPDEILLDVQQWGDVNWSSMDSAFAFRYYLEITATDLPNLSNVTNTANMFRYCLSFNSEINSWDVSNVTDMSSMFYLARNFNQDLNDWDVSNVTTMNSMFSNANSFNGNIVNWKVSNVIDMAAMFIITEFNQPIGNWDVSSVTNMSDMFHGAYNFNQDISNWNVSQVTNMKNMFKCHDLGFLTTFNQDISAWNTSNVNNMEGMFSCNGFFNQDISSWDVSNVSNMSRMFDYTLDFNQNIGNWDVSQVTNMASMFGSTESFNQDIGNWDVSNVVNMSGMFLGAVAFNQDIGGWNTSEVTNMYRMFRYTNEFNQDISEWNTSNVTNMADMLQYALVFNQDISKWTYHTEVNMENMLANSGLDCENYSKAITAWRDNPALANKIIGVEGLEYGSNKEEDRTYLIDEKGWTFIGDEMSEEECDVTVSSNGLSMPGNNIVLYPNPTYHSITIEAEAKDLEGLRVLNANRQDVSGLITIHRSGNKANIDLSRLNPGIYVLRTLFNNTKVVKM